MLKPYTRNKRQIDKIINGRMFCAKHLLETILTDKDTLYSIEEMYKYTCNSPRQLLSRITGVDNVCIVIYYELDEKYIHDIVVLDKDKGYSIRIENNGSVLYMNLVGLSDYMLFGNEKGYIVKTNYKSVSELITKLGIGVVDI